MQLPTRQTARGEVEDLKVSTNFFNRAWSGERRLRNLIIPLEWSPRAPSAHEGALPIAPDMQPRLDACLDRIWKLLVSRKYERGGASVEAEGDGAGLDAELVSLVLREAFDAEPSEQELRADFNGHVLCLLGDTRGSHLLLLGSIRCRRALFLMLFVG